MFFSHVLSIQCCFKRVVSQSYGETHSDVRGFSGPDANSSVPHEQLHHGLGLQTDVPRKTDCSQLGGETFIKVSVSLEWRLFVCQ